MPKLQNETEISNKDHIIIRNDSSKPLGITWLTTKDELRFGFEFKKIAGVINKRKILSHIAQVFDPLGLLSPATVKAKIFMQHLWKLKVSWDEPVDNDTRIEWEKLSSTMIHLNSVAVPRKATSFEQRSLVELHGFCDAFESAYGACIYLRSRDLHNQVDTKLLIAKIRVAPLKTITIPKLELYGALLLAELYKKVVDSSRIDLSNCYFWTDSTIVLGWINTAPNLLKTFVANRTAEIQKLTKISNWRHVPTADNPADVISRGIYGDEINNHKIWWNGPEFLRSPETEWPNRLPANGAELPELKPPRVFSLIKVNNEIFMNLLAKYSNLRTIKRVVAWCIRFLNNSRMPASERHYGELEPSEIEYALQVTIKAIQSVTFSKDIENLKKSLDCPTKCCIRSLSPFLDAAGLIRVGGRLKNASYPYDKKHPILVPKNNILTKLILASEHIRNMHCGPSALLATVREKYWPISGKNAVKEIARKCIICFRNNAKNLQPMMAQLPAHRVDPSPPFTNSGVDYAGPFKLKDRKGRGCKITKAYVCLFICISTKAVHLEVVSELSTDAFIAALRRFSSRRGLSANMYSDNGTNIVGAKNEINNVYTFLKQNHSEIFNELANQSIKWHFIPASAPAFGGIWEAGVKSVKFHMRRVVGETILTFEEFSTILSQIECTLNSRPLYPLSSSPMDYEPLTPAHFLTGRRINALPDPDWTETAVNRLSRWQMIQRMQQHFWKRWSSEYIGELQTRAKWTTSDVNIREGQLVIIRDDNTPPVQWKLGRVVSVHPGVDNVVRVAGIKTANGTLKRPVRKICLLAINGQ